jgi:hypothetical protein
MDQTFNFRAAPVPLRRRLNPRAIALAVTALVVLVGLVSFCRWVIESERSSIERAARAEAAARIVGTISGADDVGIGPIAASSAIDTGARADARAALGAAREAAAGRHTFLDAGPGGLRVAAGSLVFVDGESPVPGVVSVASTKRVWAAAVMGQSGTCYRLRFSPGHGTTYGTGRPCTGEAALDARGSTW